MRNASARARRKQEYPLTARLQSDSEEQVKQACVKAGLPEAFQFHELRHTYASHAVMACVPLKVVATQLGHIDTRTVDRFYSRLRNEYVATIMNERMPQLLGKE